MPLKDLSNIRGRIFVQLLVVAKYYDCDVDGAEDGNLMSLLEQPSLTLQEGSARIMSVNSASEWKIITTTYTERFLSSLIDLISILRRPMMNARAESALVVMKASRNGYRSADA